MLTSANNPMPFTSMVLADNAALDSRPAQPVANNLSSYGRFGDTELVHMSMPEVAAIEAEVGELPRNPITGMREAFPWAVAALATGVGFMTHQAQVSATNDQIRADNAKRLSEGADREDQRLAMLYNQGSVLPTEMRGFDITGAQPATMGAYFAGSITPEGRAFEKQILDNTMRAQDLNTEINVWRQQNAEPQRYITTKAKSGFFGIGGKAARTYENPEWSSWNKNLNDVVTTKTAEIQAIAQENTQLGYQRADADRGAMQAIGDQYVPMQTAARGQLGDVFSGALLDRQIAATDPLRAHRTKSAQVSIQAQKENYEKMMGEMQARTQATRGYGGDALWDRLARLKMYGSLGREGANTRMAAEGQNIAELARFRLDDEDKKLAMRAEPFRQLGMELEAKRAPSTALANQELTRQQVLGFHKIGPTGFTPQPRATFEALPSPKTLGWQGGSKLLSQVGNAWIGESNQAKTNLANTQQYNRNMDLLQEYNKRYQQQPQYQYQQPPMNTPPQPGQSSYSQPMNMFA